MQEFLDMGGYAFYVWCSFAVGLIALVYLYVSARSLHVKKLNEVSIWLTRQNKTGKG